MAKKKSSGESAPRSKAEFKHSPESEKWFKERSASPGGQKMLDELALIYVDAAVRQLLKEKEMNQGG